MGTYSEIFFLAGLVWGVTAFALLIVAWRAAAAGNIRLHRPLMIVLTVGAWLFISLYLLRYSYSDEISGEAALEVPPHLIPWLAVHGTVALIPLFGATVLVWARLSGNKSGMRLHFNKNHRRYGRVLMVLWLFTRAGGTLNFYLFG
ncbi:MAG: DUF420 domain-containing protein [Thermodesulfobacteriota bacterium]